MGATTAKLTVLRAAVVPSAYQVFTTMLLLTGVMFAPLVIIPMKAEPYSVKDVHPVCFLI